MLKSPDIAQQDTAPGPNRPESRRHRAFPADIHKVKLPLIVIEKKFTFIQDLLLAISEGVNMMRLAVLKSYEDISKIRPFEGLTGLRQRRLFSV